MRQPKRTLLKEFDENLNNIVMQRMNFKSFRKIIFYLIKFNSINKNNNINLRSQSKIYPKILQQVLKTLTLLLRTWAGFKLPTALAIYIIFQLGNNIFSKFFNCYITSLPIYSVLQNDPQIVRPMDLTADLTGPAVPIHQCGNLSVKYSQTVLVLYGEDESCWNQHLL